MRPFFSVICVEQFFDLVTEDRFEGDYVVAKVSQLQ